MTVPIVRVLQAGVALIDPPPRPVPAGFATDALRNAAAIGAELKELALPKDKAGRTVVNAATVLRVIRAHATRPLTEATEDRIPRAEIDFATGTVLLNGQDVAACGPGAAGRQRGGGCAHPGGLYR